MSFRGQFLPVISNLLLIEAEARTLGRRRASVVEELRELESLAYSSGGVKPVTVKLTKKSGVLPASLASASSQLL